MDKYQAAVNFLRTCPTIQANPSFFNFGTVENNANQAITDANEVALDKPYIDGSVQKRFIISIDIFKSVSYNPIIQTSTDENLDDFKEVQAVIDWITEQDDNRNYPTFDNCIIDKMQSMTASPNLIGLDTETTPAIAIYRIAVQIDFLDKSKQLWNS